MLDEYQQANLQIMNVSVAGCLGYDVLDGANDFNAGHWCVSVAGCLGYDVLAWLKTLI